jgi:hypothetical protein
MKAKGSQLFHDMVCAELDKIGEDSSKSLAQYPKIGVAFILAARV